ncbi:MAG: ferrous iron transport protein B [Clostridium sp.]
MKLNVALLGNPNSGKTTTFNELTGSTQHVGNWPGVTVEKKEGKLKKHKAEISIIDLPGIYSLSPYTLEEVIARDYIINEKPDLILNIVDASNLERNLYLTHQILDLDVPVIVALNMVDIVERRGDKIDIDSLSMELNVPVVPISALKSKGFDELVDAIVNKGNNTTKIKSSPILFEESLESAIYEVQSIIENNSNYRDNIRWFSIKAIEGDQKVLESIELPNNNMESITNIKSRLEDSEDDDIESIVTTARYDSIAKITKKVLTRKSTSKLTISDKIDKIVTNRILALPIFFGVMWFVYWISIQTIGDMTIVGVESIIENFIVAPIGGLFESVGAAAWIQSLILDGIIGGIGAVMGFVPQLMLLYLFIGILEDCGYMARVAFIMDRVFRRFGLSGKSFIPMLIGTGCSVPAIMASRTIENERDRKMTIMLTPFIPCSAKLPVFALLIGAFFPSHSWVGPSMYFVGIGMVIVSGIILKKTLFKGETAPFVMELPEYRMPRAKGVFIQMLERGKSFIVKAGSIIFFASGLIWLLQSFNFSFEMVQASESMLASIGRFIAPIFAPLGFGHWEAAVATVTGLLAKEAVVSTFGILAGVGETLETDPSLIGYISSMFTPVSAYAFMIFTLLAAPCFAAIGAMKREFGTWRWTFIAIGYQTGLAWVMAFIVYQVGTGNVTNLLLGGGIIGLIVLSGIRFIKSSKNSGCGSGCSGCSAGCSSRINEE